MVKIRLARKGAKKAPFYHIHVIDSRASREGGYIERLGFFNPVARGESERLRLDTESYTKWLEKGAQPTERVAKLFREAQSAQ